MPAKNPNAPYHQTMKKAESDILRFFLEETEHRIEDAARLAGVSKDFFYRRMVALDIPRRRRGAPKKQIHEAASIPKNIVQETAVFAHD